MLSILTARSSSDKVVVSRVATARVVPDEGTTPVTPATPVKNNEPVPSSTIVAVPLTVTLAEVAFNLKVLARSEVLSFKMEMRTNKAPLLSKVTVPVVYVTHAEPFQY